MTELGVKFTGDNRDLIYKITQSEKALNRLRVSVLGARSPSGKVVATLNKYAESYARAAKKIADEDAYAARLSAASIKAGNDIEKARAARAELAYKNSLMGRLNSVAGTFFGQYLGANIVMRAVSGLKQLFKDAVQAEITLSRIRTTLESVTGSSKAARDELGFLFKEAYRVGFSVEGAADNYARFSVAAKQAGWTAQQTRKSFTSMMEASAVLGLGAQRTSDALLALEQMLSKGRVQSEELRRQLGNAMPAAINTMARALNMTLPQMYKALDVGAVEASSAVRAFTEQVSKDFQLTDTANRTVRDLNAITTAAFQLKASIGSLMSGEVQRFLEGWTQVLNTGGTPGEGGAQGITVWSYLSGLAGAAMSQAPANQWHNIAMGYDVGRMEQNSKAIDKGEIQKALRKKNAALSEMATGKGKTIEAQIAEATQEAVKNDSLNEILLRQASIRRLLTKEITTEQRARLNLALNEATIALKKKQTDDPVKKAQYDVEAAKAKLDATNGEIRNAYKRMSEIDSASGITFRNKREAVARELGLIATLGTQAEMEGDAVSAAQAALVMTKKNKNAGSRHASADVTEFQRLSAYAGGPGQVTIDLQRQTVNHLATLVQYARNGQRTGRGGTNFGGARAGW